MLLWLPRRLLHVFVGTYMSRNEDVRRAGLVADINALALAVAVILLLTSRATFNEAEETNNHQGWANLLQDRPADTCATFNQEPFEGLKAHSLHFRCDDHGGWRVSLPLNATKKVQSVLPVLQALHNDCHVFAMAIHYVHED